MSVLDHSDDELCDEEFDLVEDEDSEAFQCQACAKGHFRPCILACGHRLCVRCLDSNCPLPGCGEPVHGYSPKQSSEIRERFMDLRAYCPNRKYGCLHEMPIRDMKGHLAKCEAAPTNTNVGECSSKVGNDFDVEKNITKEEKSEDKTVIAEVKIESKSEIEEEIMEWKHGMEMTAKLEKEIERLKKSERMRESALSTFLQKLSELKEETDEKMNQLRKAQDLKFAEALSVLTSKDLSTREIEKKQMADGFSLIDLLNVKRENEKLVEENFRLKYKLRKYEQTANYDTYYSEDFVPVA